MVSWLERVRFVLTVHWISWSAITQSWQFFFRQEVYSLAVFFSTIFLWHHFITGWCVTGVVMKVVGVVAFRRWMAGGLCSSTRGMEGKTVIVTGANVGIGFETSRDLLRRGAHVILACRNVIAGEEARRRLLGEGGRSEVRQLDLSCLASVRSFAEGIIKDGIKVHLLINNAGVMMCPYSETKEGFELQMGTNHLGHFLLTNLLLPQLQHDQEARIINVSSLAHIRGKMDFNDLLYKNKKYDKVQAYGNSKLANILFTRQLAKRLKGTNIQVFSLHPGTVYSQLARHLVSSSINNWLAPLLLKTTAEGAQTTIYCATEATQHPHMYFSDCAPLKPTPEATDDAAAEQLWRMSADLVKLQG
ncbi:Short-chain dehydrogenase/reductase SDR [Trinorchestia longiramus]|nr:Short-chain dehydrogenase/reductase SDR [Trinorchestia longiramus]